MRNIHKIIDLGEQRTLGRTAITNYEIQQIAVDADGNLYKAIVTAYHLGVELGFRRGYAEGNKKRIAS